jgi:2,3-bisphosphoglycerate-independent phosphoglycerate mutase
MSNNARPAGPVVLIVLDGWGYRAEREGNAIELAHTPVWHGLWQAGPRTLLDASGLAVGLPAGQMGNSEVGHLNLGAGRVVTQDLVRIDRSIATGEFYELDALRQLATQARQDGGTFHLVGLIGSGGVHAIDRHLRAALEFARRADVPRIAVHGFLDGRDTPPTSALGFVRELGTEIARSGGQRACLATVTGRYFAMDRDRRWDRTRLAYDAMVKGIGTPTTDVLVAIQQSYDAGVTDEFIRPIVIHQDGHPAATIRDGDAVFCFNYRADRMRQLCHALLDDPFTGFDVSSRPRVTLATMTQYDRTLAAPQAFAPISMAHIMAEVLADAGKSQLRTAETEKYAHVTYFFNGGYEPPYRGEERALIPSQKVATYDLAPEMSAAGITDTLCGAIEARQHDFILCNYANADMVGHTGVAPAILKAVETVDASLARVLVSAEKARARVVITADHGNCEVMVDPATGGPHTSHTSNPVPLVTVGAGPTPLRDGGALCDVAPTLLGLLGIDPPAEMTGRDLRKS